MQAVKKKQSMTYETEISTTGYLGRNSWGNHSALRPNESQSLINWDLFKGDSEEYVKSRYGSAYLKKASSPTKRGSTSVINAITWDIGAEEYLITQEGNSFYYQALLTTADPVLIVHAITGSFTVSDTTQAEMFLSDDKIYIFHSGGNKIIRWTGSAFVGIEMGLNYPVISSVDVTTAGIITGSYTIGVELVYQVSGVDIFASTPNRYTTGRILAVTGTIASKRILLAISATVLDATPVNWTHLRVWRSKNKNTDYTDPLNPIDPQGIDNELYEECLMTKAEINAGSLTAIATGSTLPLGNAGVTAGKPAGIYTITLNNADSVFSVLTDISRIELLPMPNASCGCFHAGLIFVANTNDSTLDDASKNNIYYSLYAGTRYSTQYNPLNFIGTSRDGQQMVKLISFEKDLIGIKEAKTGRLPNGDITLKFETTDHRIGIFNKNLARVIPGVGIVAITNDFSDFRIFGYNLIWSSIANGIEISLPIRVETAAMTAANVSFAYVNGKLMISDGTGIVYVLHNKEQRGWTTYSFPMNSLAQRLFAFANGSRAAVVSKSTHLVEIEISTSTTDVSTADDVTTNLITLTETGYRFQMDEGKANLEQMKLDVTAELSAPLVAIPYVNGTPWPLATSTTSTKLVPDPAIYGITTGLRDGDYTLYTSPATIGQFQWCRLRGNFIHYTLTTTAPAIMRTKKLTCIVDTNRGFGDFDPFQKYIYANKYPVWNADVLWLFNFDDDTTTLYDQSGNSYHHTWADGSGSRAHLASQAPGGGESATGGAGSGWGDASYTDMTYIGDSSGSNSQDLAYQIIASFPSLSSTVTIKQGGDGTYFYRINVNTDGSLEYQIKTSALSYKFKTATGVITAGATVYDIQFLLTGGGATGAWYLAGRTDSGTVYQATTRSAL